jgi:hypothetical protein
MLLSARFKALEIPTLNRSFMGTKKVFNKVRNMRFDEAENVDKNSRISTMHEHRQTMDMLAIFQLATRKCMLSVDAL